MHSKLIARLMGPVLLVMGLGMALGLWLSPDTFNGVMRDFMGNLAIIWLIGILALVAGLAIINAHNLWIGDWRVLITILGWLLMWPLHFAFAIEVKSADQVWVVELPCRALK